MKVCWTLGVLLGLALVDLGCHRESQKTSIRAVERETHETGAPSAPRPELGESTPDVEGERVGGLVGVADSSPPFIASPFDDPNTEGPLDKAAIQATIRKNNPQVGRCYDAGRDRNPDLEGTITLEFTITPEGLVALASVAESSLGDLLVERCVIEAVKRIRFPRHNGSADAKVRYPYVFRPPER